MRVLSKLFRGLMLARLLAAHAAGKLQFFGNNAALIERKAFTRYLAPLRRRKWYVNTKPPFGRPQAVSPISRAIPTALPSPTAD